MKKVIQIVDGIIWGQPMKYIPSMTHGTPISSVMQLWSTLYYTWGLRMTNVTNAHYVVTTEPHLPPTGYVSRHLEVHELESLWDLLSSVIDTTT